MDKRVDSLTEEPQRFLNELDFTSRVTAAIVFHDYANRIRGFLHTLLKLPISWNVLPPSLIGSHNHGSLKKENNPVWENSKLF